MSLGRIWGENTLQALYDIGRETENLRTFFGAPVHCVHPLILRLSIETNRAEWLRGAQQLKHLPRWYQPTNGFEYLQENQGWKSFPFPRDRQPERVVWIIEQLTGRWYFNSLNQVLFETDHDAVIYRLRWE